MKTGPFALALLLSAWSVLAAERPCWNRRSVMFLDAPTFAFETVSNDRGGDRPQCVTLHDGAARPESAPHRTN